MRTFLRENGLSVFFLTMFLVTLLAQSFAGQHSYNAEQLNHEASAVSWWEYVTSVNYWGAVMENWQSEFLQFTFFIGATIWLVQKGSNESKRLEDVGTETDEQQKVGRHIKERSPRWAKARGLKRRLYENSLLITMTSIFFATWAAQSLNNWRMFNDEQREHADLTVSWSRYLLEPDFWEKTVQNWQSEFLAVGVMVVFTIYLRQRGSPESKPVGAPHDETGTSG
jgi:Domain of unknown function (DUF6766)